MMHNDQAHLAYDSRAAPEVIPAIGIDARLLEKFRI